MNRIARTTIVTAAAAALTLPLATVPASAGPGDHPVSVSGLSVDGRDDTPLDVDSDRPLLGWTMSSEDTPGNPCYDASAAGTCAIDEQTAYEIEAASSVADLEAGDLLWDSGKISSDRQANIAYGGDDPLESRDSVAWRVRVWDALGHPSEWSEPATFKIGLLQQSDWGDARWIEQADRDPADPLPIFARQFDLDEDKDVASAHLYVSGAGLHHATVNGEKVTEEHLAPGNTNYQLSTEYRTYDVSSVLEPGENAVGVELGNGTAYVRRSIHNEEVGRTSPYAWWQSQIKGSGELVAPVEAGATTVLLTSTEDYHVGGTINIDTGDGGDRLESRVITDIGTAGEDGTGISFEPGLDAAHAVGAHVTASGNNIAETDPSAGAAVTPRMIARLEVSYADGSSDVVVSDRDWRAASGALVTDAWYSGEDYDARREQVGWNTPGADLTDGAERRDGSAMNWAAAGIAPPPNLATELVARQAEGIYEAERFTPQNITNPAEGVWVFDFGQNFAGFAQLDLPELPEGTVVKVKPAESLAEDGTVDQGSLGPGFRGNDLFNSYITAGLEGGESRTPMFNYFGMQWVQIEGLPADYTPTADIVTGLRLQAATPEVGTFDSSNDRINRINKMARYSMASQIFSTFTDCPGREKQSYPADYTMPMDGFSRMFEFDAYLRTTQRHLVEGQSIADSYMFGNVALKTPVHDWGYTRRFGDEINWGNGIILVPAFLYEYYGDTRVMTETYDRMVYFVEYIQREKAEGHIVDGALADWVSAEQTSGRITGTWGYYVMMTKMAMMAELTGHDEDAAEFAQTAEDIKAAFNDAFLNTDLGYYTEDGTGADGATQAAQALPLDAGIVPDEYRESVLERLVEDVQEFGPDDGPHFSAGTIGLAAVVRQLTDNGHGEVLFDALQTDTEPGYGYFMESTTANPDGFTTIGERWTRGSSKNHMILAQIVEWFQTGLVGIDRADGSVGYDELVFKPQPAGDLTWVEGSFDTPRGVASSRWDKTDEHFTLTIEVPANTTAEVWVPTGGDQAVLTPSRATFERVEGEFAVYSVGAGEFTFVAAEEGYDDIAAAVESFAGDGALSEQLADNLSKFIDRAREASAEGKAQTADSALRAFRNQIENANSKRASDEAVAELAEMAADLQALLRQEGGIPVDR
ncbi:family 78 glycoside hydrolase catalytic domain [Isoptericola sp. AK164]|uniref:family 78 glycoside hydrolase catalytic domain n=1 Tax=Isoptericola sp. AK164 TaxID=3024246 RepID=UPI0024185FB4|nr:family 78 glycoside hydrolase catalytic domain [Isoptericola sp. AK164]